MTAGDCVRRRFRPDPEISAFCLQLTILRLTTTLPDIVFLLIFELFLLHLNLKKSENSRVPKVYMKN